MESVLRGTQRTLGLGGCVAVNRIKNDPHRNPEGMYAKLDHQLARLSILNKVAHRKARTVDEGGHSAMGWASAAGWEGGTNDVKAEKTFWAKGTGYGHGAMGGWDIDAYVTAEREKDSLVADVLS